MKLQTAPGTQTLHVDDDEYTPDELGQIDVHDESHIRPLKAMGCTIIGDDAPTLTVIEGGDADAALAHENEQLKLQIGNLKDQINGLQEEVSKSAQVEEGLRDRIQELEAAVKAAPEGAGAPAGTEVAQEVPGAPGDAPPAPESPIHEVGGIVVSDPEAFDSMEYNLLKEWLAEHGVHTPSNISKVNAIAACKGRYAELTASKE